jgi:hypothetical protein
MPYTGALRAVAQLVSRQLLTAEVRVLSQVSPCEICGGRSGTIRGFRPSTSILLCQYYYSNGSQSFSS